MKTRVSLRYFVNDCRFSLHWIKVSSSDDSLSTTPCQQYKALQGFFWAKQIYYHCYRNKGLSLWLQSWSNEVNLCIWFDCNFIGFSQNIGHWEPKSSCYCSVYVEQFLERSLIKPYFVHLVAKFDVGNTLFNPSWCKSSLNSQNHSIRNWYIETVLDVL